MSITYVPNKEERLNKDVHVKKLIDKLDATRFGLGEEYIEFKHVMEHFPTPILVTSADTEIIYVNPAWEKLTGYTLTEVEGKNPNLLHSNKTPTSVLKKMWKTLGLGKPFVSEEIINQKKDGKEFQINSTIFPIHHSGNTLFYVQVQEDITIRKKLDELKRQFLHAATHELKTPIAALKLLIQLQLKRAKKLDQQSDVTNSLTLVDRELDRLTRLINELSDVTRIESGKLKMDIREVDITQIIADVISQMKTLSKGHKIHFSMPSSVIVLADADRVKQVLINIINNNIKYSAPGSRIEVGLHKSGKYVTVSVKDQGEGIPGNKVRAIFERYYQIEKEKQVGLGLGLYIAREIITQHKGKIWVKSKKGEGSTFYFTLRLA